MRVSKRIITFFLSLAMLFSLFTVAGAAEPAGLLVDNSSVNSWNTFAVQNDISSFEYWTYANDLMSRAYIGATDSYDQLCLIVEKYDLMSSGVAGILGQVFIDLFAQRDYIVMYDNSLGVYRPYDNNRHMWFVNSMGHFPYYGKPSDSGSSGTPGVTGSAYSFWLRSEVQGISLQILPQDDLKSIASRYSGYVRQLGEYYMIVDVTGSKVLCAAGGHRLAAIVDPDQTAVDQPNDYYTDPSDTPAGELQGGGTIINEGDTFVYEGDEITNNNTTVYEGDETTNNQFINIHDNTFQNADGDILNIDNLYYDESTHSYYVNAHDEYVYNSTTNEYTTNTYTIKVTYDVHYTSVTYIGQTEEFEADTYVYYYQLPDGRSSADLTAEDLEQLSLAFTDVVNYARSTDAADMRCLYHFDGNTEDSSYWSYVTQFDWDKGASLTYLDEGVFDGSLYLDETEHEFTITLPNESDAAYDFTLQFRYYQSATAAPVKDSFIRFGGYTFLQFDGSHYYTGTGVDLGATSVGTWNEICMMRSGDTVYYYINGVCVDSVKSSTVFPSEIIFHFGSDQQTYKKLDELRYTRNAVYAPGADYTPSAVPFDTNLTLILPDGERPLADEIAVVTPSDTNLLIDSELFDWSAADTLSRIQPEATSQDNYLFDLSHGFQIYAFDADLKHSGSSISFSASGTPGVPGDSTSSSIGWEVWEPQNCLFIPLSHGYSAPNTYRDSLISNDQQYTLTLVYADGAYDSFVFTQRSIGFSLASSSGADRISCLYHSANRYNTLTDVNYYSNGLVLTPAASGDTVDIVYMEIVPGNESDYTLTWETAMYSSGELEKSPVLAVRSNTPISTYLFGGVRPSYPERGMVWAMIEGHRIVSLQQYTGSAWVEVDGRIWTGKRWIPYGSFDVYTLQDCWDVVDSGEDSDYEYIYSESGFWAWIQKALLKIMDKLDAIITLLGGDPENLPGGSSGNDQDKTFWQRVKGIFENALAEILEALLELITKILDLVLGMIYDLLEFFFGLLTDGVLGAIDSFFDALTDGALLQFFRTEEPLLDEYGQPVVDENGDPVMVTVVALPSGVAGVFAFISATIMALPADVRSVLIFGVGALLLLAVLKLFKA